jgi:RHS repeat-associated protein
VRFSTGALPTDKKFTGQRLDNTGLYYYGARYYDPALGRFISPDTVVQNPSNPQTLNRYSYCLNNPLIYTDPTGNQVNVEGCDIGEYLDFIEGMRYGIFTNPTAGMANTVATLFADPSAMSLFNLYCAMRSIDLHVARVVEDSKTIVNIKWGTVSNSKLYGETTEYGGDPIDLVMNNDYKSAELPNLAGHLGHEMFHCLGATFDPSDIIGGSYFEETMAYRYESYITTRLGGTPSGGALWADVIRVDKDNFWNDLGAQMNDYFKNTSYEDQNLFTYPTDRVTKTINTSFRDNLYKFVLKISIY